MSELLTISTGHSGRATYERHTPLAPTARADAGAARRPTDIDVLDLSEQARRAQRDEDAPIRADLVRRVRESIGHGEYLTPERIDEAVERLYGDLIR